jgi:hypothetical protein
MAGYVVRESFTDINKIGSDRLRNHQHIRCSLDLLSGSLPVGSEYHHENEVGKLPSQLNALISNCNALKVS